MQLYQGPLVLQPPDHMSGAIILIPYDDFKRLGCGPWQTLPQPEFMKYLNQEVGASQDAWAYFNWGSTIFLFFRKENDALLFLLRWSA
jgi:hypothetical protein